MILTFKKGYKPSEEQRRKQSKAKLGHKPWHKGKTGVYSKEALEKMSKAKKGRKLSPEHIQKVSQALKGKKRPLRSEEWQKKLTQSIRKSHNTPAVKKKLSESHKGQKAWNKGKKTPPEVIKKLSKSHMGIIPSEESRRKNSIAGIKRFQDPKEREKQRQIRLNMKIPQKDSIPEKIMQRLLREQAIEFNTHVPIMGQPDIFIKPDLCIFLDGNFYHANPKMHSADHLIWKKYKNTPERRAKDIWEKDERVNKILESQGKTVLRFWEYDIENNPEKCLQKIIKAIKESRHEH